MSEPIKELLRFHTLFAQPNLYMPDITIGFPPISITLKAAHFIFLAKCLWFTSKFLLAGSTLLVPIAVILAVSLSNVASHYLELGNLRFMFDSPLVFSLLVGGVSLAISLWAWFWAWFFYPRVGPWVHRKKVNG